MPKDLTALFSPRSIAVIGASRSPEKVGAIVLKNIIESKYPGKIFPVNPNTDSINGLPCYKDLAGLPEVPELAVLALPGPLVLEILPQIGERGIKNAVVFAAGFKEAGEEGAKQEQVLVEQAEKYGLNLLGPNCLGFVNNTVPVNVTFGEQVQNSGNLRFISQSGAIAASLFDWCKSTGVGFSEFVTLGNKAVISENDVLKYFQSSKKDSSAACPVGLYLESIADGKKFVELTSKISKTDPIFILKPGKSEAAAKAMHSHTGAIAGEEAVLETALAQSGVVRCQSLEEFFDLTRAFAFTKAPLGPKVAIISNAGGPAVISADAVTEEGLSLAEFDDQVKARLMEVLPRTASVLNPVDVLGDALADRFAQASEIILQTNEADALVVILTPQIMTEISKTAQVLGELSQKYDKPIFCSFMGGSRVAEGEQKLNGLKIPVFSFPERAIRVVGAMWRWKRQQTEPVLEEESFLRLELSEEIKVILEEALAGGQTTLDNLQSDRILLKSGISTPPTKAAADLGDAKDFAKEYKWPVVLKLSSPGLIHKKEIGGVIRDLGNDYLLEKAWNKLERKVGQNSPEKQPQFRIQVQKDVGSGVELLIGVRKDPVFGRVLLFGAGGSLAELIGDRNLHLLPLGESGAKELVEKSKIFPILEQEVGSSPEILQKLVGVIVRLGKLAEGFPEISEIEINPLIATINGLWAVDGKVLLESRETKMVEASQFQVAKVVGRVVPAGKYRYFEFETEKPFVFLPGQYVSVRVGNDRLNCYSVAGQRAPHRFELLVDTAPGGPGSRFFENLEVGDKMTYLGPFGTFTLKEGDGGKQLAFFATGSGLAPVKCMIESILRKGSTVPVTLYWGLSFPRDVFWQDYFQKLSAAYPNFKCKIAVWKPDPGWQGATGFVTELARKDFLQAGDLAAYLCGNKNMIAEASQFLVERGLPSERVYTEKY